MNKFENEVPKHMKKKNSNVSKSKEKSKHKHDYRECFLKYKFKKHDEKYNTSLGAYCIVCGKLGDCPKDTVIEELKDKSSFDRAFISFRHNIVEIEEKYKDVLPTFYMDDMMDKYIKLE